MPQLSLERRERQPSKMEKLAESSIQVRPARKEDLPGVHELEASSFKDPFPPYFIDQLANANPETFLVAVEDSRIVGYAVVDNWTDHQHLVSLAVSTGSRRKGIGQALLGNMFARVREGQLQLELRKSNHAALSLYRKNGFTETGIAHSYYTDGEDAITMERRIEKKAEVLATA